MKRKGNLYKDIYSEDNIRLAIQNAARDHAHDPAVIAMKTNPDKYLSIISDILINESFVQSKYTTTKIREHGKERTLRYTRTFPDRVIQHCLIQVIGPIISKSFIHDTYASIKGKGLHKANLRIKSWFKDIENTKYCLKLDIRHYFDSINRGILFKAIKRYIKCPQTLNLIYKFIFEAPGTGIPIGNYLSQYLSNVYLTSLDHYCKEKLGIRYYIRYMDDIVIFAASKGILHRYKKFIEEALKTKLHLNLKRNHQVFPIDKRGLDFIGFVFRHGYIMIRKRVKLSYIRSVNCMVYAIKHRIGITTHMVCSHISYTGFMMWGNTKHLMNKYEGKLEGYILGVV